MKFKSTQAMNTVGAYTYFGTDVITDYNTLFSTHGEGVYVVSTGSRGMVEHVEFVGAGADFDFTDYTDYEGQLEQAKDDIDEDADDDDRADTLAGFEYDMEFTTCDWDGMVFVCGRSEEEADVYIHFAPSVVES